MKVLAAKGLLVPKEDKPREYINDSDAVDVPASTYYLRIIADGDLINVDDGTVDTLDGVKNTAKKGE